MPAESLAGLLGQVRHIVIGGDAPQQRLDPGQPLGGDKPELGGMAADGIAELGAPADQALARAEQHLQGGLLGALHRHQPLLHARPAHRFAERRGIRSIVLAALDIGPHVLRRHQHHLVAKLPEFPSPVVAAATSLQPDHCRLQLLEEGQELPAPQLALQHLLLGLVDPVQLEYALRRIDPDP